MLDDAACLPPEPVHHCADAAGFVVEEALGVNVSRSEHGDLRRAPDGTEEVKGGVGAVGGERVVVLGDTVIRNSDGFTTTTDDSKAS